MSMAAQAGRLAGKIAIITGGGSGIGRAVALAFASEGCSVVLAGRRPEPLAETVEAIQNVGARALAVPTDLRDPAAICTLFERTKSEFGRLDILFNNAGTNTPQNVALEEVSLEQWRSVIDVNLTASFLCTQQAFQIMKTQSPPGGRIINNGSVSADRPRPNSAPYTSSKHAITGLTKATSLDGRKYGIACGQIDIGNAVGRASVADGPDATTSGMASIMSSGVLQADGQTRPEPTMDVQDVARAVVYMAGLPPEANCQWLTVMASTMPLIGRG
jgi:NAD(P)-dependent dehydrogenase (short-subunit alcohol dehydrogenase family)